MINEIFLNEEEKWDSIIKSFGEYDVYYLSGYVKAFQINGDGEPLLLFFEDKDIRAVNVVIKRDVASFEKLSEMVEKNRYYDIVTPYGYGGFIVEGKDTSRLEEEYVKYCQDHNIVCEFVRFHPLLKNYQSLDHFYHQCCLGKTIAINTETAEIIWKNFTSKNRNMVRKAQKSGLKVYWTRDESIIDVFMEIYNATMDKDEADDYYYFDRKFYESILNDLKYNALWFYTKKEDEIAAISIFLFANGRMHYHLSASRKKYQSLAPTNLLLYEASLWASQNGYKFLHLGGGFHSREDGLYAFKKSFNRNSENFFYTGKKIFCREIYDSLVNCREFSENFESGYFPLYRA